MATINGNIINRKQTAPLAVPRTRRAHDVRVLSSFKAGKMVPLAAIPVLREDSLSGRYVFSFEMQETAEILMNAVNVDVFAYVVPWLAFERFQGSMDILNKSWEGEAWNGTDVVPFNTMLSVGTETLWQQRFGEDSIMRAMGLHAKWGSGEEFNAAYIQAYNAIWNYRAANRSPDIALRSQHDVNLAPAFWKHQAMAHIVPDFDQAAMDGNVPLDIVASRLSVGSDDPVYVQGLYRESSNARTMDLIGGAEGEPATTAVAAMLGARTSGGGAFTHTPYVDFSNVYAEMEGEGITISLANIELARKTQAFAELRKQYEGHNDEWLINMLMDGLTIPDQALKQPMLLGHASTIFGFQKRYSTEAENLDVSAVNGMTQLALNIHLPRLVTGGVVMFVAEVTPDQLWERKQDPLLNMVKSVDDFPHYLRDTLDPEKVEVVQGQYVDVDHDNPETLFGYAPLNHAWDVRSPRVGGKFYRPEVDEEFDEDRQRIWAAETANPTLSTDFYLATQMHQKPFLDANADAFEVIANGVTTIEGNTVFGRRLIEASDSYEKVMEKAPMERIEKPE